MVLGAIVDGVDPGIGAFNLTSGTRQAILEGGML